MMHGTHNVKFVTGMFKKDSLCAIDRKGLRRFIVSVDHVRGILLGVKNEIRCPNARPPSEFKYVSF